METASAVKTPTQEKQDIQILISLRVDPHSILARSHFKFNDSDLSATTGKRPGVVRMKAIFIRDIVDRSHKTVFSAWTAHRADFAASGCNDIWAGNKHIQNRQLTDKMAEAPVLYGGIFFCSVLQQPELSCRKAKESFLIGQNRPPIL